MPRDIALRLAPLHPDPHVVGLEDGAPIWCVTSPDPAFTARVPDDAEPLRRGWYRARATLDTRSGEVREPRLYIPDRKGRYAEDRAVGMVREGDAYTAEFFLAQASDGVRFDPSTARCEFACDALHLTAIERPLPGPRLVRALGLWALWHLVDELRARVRRRALRAKRLAGERLAARRNAQRKARVLATIDRNGLGIEIGPSHDPIAPKREGFHVHVIDHASRQELMAKYATHGISLERIEDVDFIWKGESYLELTGKPKHYDWIIASHLIEHMPDLIGFLADCDSILKDDGVLSLVIPDKRYCFDRFRPITGLARVIDSHAGGNKVHSEGTIAEYFMNVAAKGNVLTWDERSKGDYRLLHSLAETQQAMREARQGETYLDVHNWCFVPHSFRLLLADLHTLGYTKLREVHFEAPGGYEFYVALGRHGTGPDLGRLELLRQIDAELRARA